MTDSQPYRVLARKYRPQSFSALIGQDAMVKTLGNAIRRERIAHAFLLTGVRGVGKTSTARLIAKALNCVGPTGQGEPTIDPCGVCEPCRAIAEGRHIDVVEIDAASHNGIDDIREISEAIRYSAVSARYKIYIVDEVHMLSKPAFNAILKTLEEPPPHVKFLLATTEVQKVPVTVLSRCQRFDLRRIPAEALAAHFAAVCAAEAVAAEPEALLLIARAAEGSARDGLSILDQAIAHADGMVTAVQLRDMLGLSDRGAIRALFADLLRGDAAAVLMAVARQHELGVDPAALLRGLLETCHGVTRAKVGGGEDPAIPPEARAALADWASRLGFATLHRLWQLLLKGHEEVQRAALPLEACEMALLRVVHASHLPDPGELARRIAGGEVAAPSPPLAVSPAVSPPAVSPPATPPPAAQAALLSLPGDFSALVALVDRADKILGHQLHDYVGLIRYAPPELEMRPTRLFDVQNVKKLAAVLRAATGTSWTITLGEGPAAPTLHDQALAAASDAEQRVMDMPVVKAAFEAFPQAELIGYRLDEQGSA